MNTESCQGKILRVPEILRNIERKDCCQFQKAFFKTEIELATPSTNRYLILKMNFAQVVETLVCNNLQLFSLYVAGPWR